MRQKRRTGCGFLLMLLLTILILGGAWVFTAWRSAEAVLPPGLTINGVSMGGMTRGQALTAIEQAYTVPISVTYAGQPVSPLLPEIIELRVDMEATAENLDEAIAAEADLDAFVTYLFDQVMGREPETVDVNAVVLYSREQVNAYLKRAAQKHDHPPLKAVALPESGTFRPAAEGTTLDIDASLPLLIEAILAADPRDRQVSLVVETEPPPDTSPDILLQALNTSLSDFDGVAGVFVKDLEQGHELCLNCEVAFGGMGAMEVGILLELYRTHDLPLAPELVSLVNAMGTQRDDTALSDNEAADVLLTELGGGDPYEGARAVTDLLGNLGLRSSFLAAPYAAAAGGPTPAVETEANSRTDLTTNPDPTMQTTPIELGLVMESLYQCSRGGGSLRALYPHALPPVECQAILDWLARTQTRMPLGNGMPPGTQVIGKHTWDLDTHLDAALIYGPKTDFVVVAFLYDPAWSSWQESAPTFAEVGGLTYRYFNGIAETPVAGSK